MQFAEALHWFRGVLSGALWVSIALLAGRL